MYFDTYSMSVSFGYRSTNNSKRSPKDSVREEELTSFTETKLPVTKARHPAPFQWLNILPWTVPLSESSAPIKSYSPAHRSGSPELHGHKPTQTYIWWRKLQETGLLTKNMMKTTDFMSPAMLMQKQHWAEIVFRKTPQTQWRQHIWWASLRCAHSEMFGYFKELFFWKWVQNETHVKWCVSSN